MEQIWHRFTMMKNLRDQGHTIDILHADSDSTTAARLKHEFKDLGGKKE